MRILVVQIKKVNMNLFISSHFHQEINQSTPSSANVTFKSQPRFVRTTWDFCTRKMVAAIPFYDLLKGIHWQTVWRFISRLPRHSSLFCHNCRRHAFTVCNITTSFIQLRRDDEFRCYVLNENNLGTFIDFINFL